MRVSFIFFFILLLCNLYRAQEHSRRGATSSKDDSETKMFKSEERTDELKPEKDIREELGQLRDLVSAQAEELKLLSAKLAESVSRMKVLQEEITVMKDKVTAAETLVKEKQMEREAQSAEFTMTQQNLSILQERLLVNVAHEEELQENREVSKVDFSTSPLVTGKGNTFHDNGTTLVFRNVITNPGDHYNLFTGFFTAPVRGFHYFRFASHVAHNEHRLLMRIMKNDNPIVSSGDRHTQLTDLEDNMSNGVLLELEVGDLVALRLSGEVWHDQYHRTTFSGFLLFAL